MHTYIMTNKIECNCRMGSAVFQVQSSSEHHESVTLMTNKIECNCRMGSAVFQVQSSSEHHESVTLSGKRLHEGVI